MISRTAIDALDELTEKGLRPTPEDVVRLNAAGLKLEAARGKNVGDCTYLLPRVAAISETISFRQPTIGHEIWLDKVAQVADTDDYQTLLSLNAFALSRPVDDLPDPYDRAAVKDAAGAFLETLRDYTRDQIYAAINYCRYGADVTAGEKTATTATDGDLPADESPDWDECVAVGVLNEGRAVLWGMSAAEMKRMTASELSAVISRARLYHQMPESSSVDFWTGRFYATLDEIESRLTKEAGNNG